MPILKPCLEYVDGRPCGEPSTESRCPTHRREFERKLLRKEPWRALYDTWQWVRVKPVIHRRDGHRCTFTVAGRRCATTDMLSVHHERKVRLLWQDAKGQWKRFLKLATDPNNLRLLCAAHHKHVDSNDTQLESKTRAPNAARSEVRRQRQAGRRASRRRRQRDSRS